MDHIDGQMAHIMADSSVSHVRLRKKVERGVVTGHDLHVFCIRSANAGSDCSTRFYLRVAMRPTVFRQEHLETRQQPLQEPSMPWVSGFLGRKGVLDALLRGSRPTTPPNFREHHG